VVALDTRDAAEISVIGKFAVTGNIADSRIVGDVLYVAAYEDGYCWDCSDKPRTNLSSLDVRDPAGISKVDELSFEERQDGYSWRRSVMATDQRLDIAGPTWSATGSEPVGSTIQVVEMLQSVRFDGSRGYAVTFERTDPLFTLDLSNPAQPRQAGELEMPGWLYHMEPRGDRLLGLGFDQGNAEGAITVSLFDVGDLAKPTMIDRVNFGGDWGSLPEDQDRIHKAFNILDDQGLVWFRSRVGSSPRSTPTAVTRAATCPASSSSISVTISSTSPALPQPGAKRGADSSTTRVCSR
jgi:hypothetical protein